MDTGDILYGTVVAVTGVASYRVIRAPTVALLAKIVLVGGALALLNDFHNRHGWQFGAAHGWLWKMVTPDRALIAGLAAAMAMTLRDRYAPMVSETGIIVRSLRVSAEADLRRQWNEAEAVVRRYERETRERLEAEERAARARIEDDLRAARLEIGHERDQLRRAREEAVREKENAARLDAYKVLGVRPGTSSEELKRRYRALVAAYHPDKASNTTPEIRQLAEEKVKEINAAYGQVIGR